MRALGTLAVEQPRDQRTPDHHAVGGGGGLGGLLVNEAMGRQGFLMPIYLASAMAAIAAVGVVLFLRESRAKADPEYWARGEGEKPPAAAE